MTKKKQKPFMDIQLDITKEGVKYGVTISKDEDGYFARTHRASSRKRYSSKRAIPKSVLKSVERTG